METNHSLYPAVRPQVTWIPGLDNECDIDISPATALFEVNYKSQKTFFRPSFVDSLYFNLVPYIFEFNDTEVNRYLSFNLKCEDM